MFSCWECPAKDVWWSSLNNHNRNWSFFGMYSFSWYHIQPSHFEHSSIVLSLKQLFVQIAPSIFRGSRPGTNVPAMSSARDGWPWMGGLSGNRRNCCVRFCSCRITCSILFNLSPPPPQGGLEASFLKHMLFRLFSLGYKQLYNQSRLNTRTILLVSDWITFLTKVVQILMIC